MPTFEVNIFFQINKKIGLIIIRKHIVPKIIKTFIG